MLDILSSTNTAGQSTHQSLCLNYMLDLLGRLVGTSTCVLKYYYSAYIYNEAYVYMHLTNFKLIPISITKTSHFWKTPTNYI